MNMIKFLKVKDTQKMCCVNCAYSSRESKLQKPSDQEKYKENDVEKAIIIHIIAEILRMSKAKHYITKDNEHTDSLYISYE